MLHGADCVKSCIVACHVIPVSSTCLIVSGGEMCFAIIVSVTNLSEQRIRGLRLQNAQPMGGHLSVTHQTLHRIAIALDSLN